MGSDTGPIMFDVVGTLFSPDRAKEVLAERGHPREVFDLWLARLLHASFAATLAGRYTPYDELARTTLEQVLALRGLEREGVEAAADSLSELDPWPDADECLETLRGRGHPLHAITNGGIDATRSLMEDSGLGRHFETLNSADAVEAAKPHPRPYRDLLDRLGVEPGDATLVAVHGWDVLGADAVGMRTVYVDRVEKRWPFTGSPPHLGVHSLAEVPGALTGHRPAGA